MGARAMTTPALPPGFVLDAAPQTAGHPPLPPGFQLVESVQQPTEQPVDPTEGMSFGEKFGAGMGKAFVDTARGLKQAGTEALDYVAGGGTMDPASIVNRVVGGREANRYDNAVTQATGRSLASQQANIDEAKRLDAPLMDTGAGLAGNVTGYAAQALAPGAALRGTGIARAMLPTTVAGNALLGGATAALQPVASDESRLGKVATGTAFGAGGAVLAKGIGAVASKAGSAISDQARTIYQAAKERGIQLTPAQLSDSRFLKFAQSMLRSVPFTGAQGRYAAQVGDFNKALTKTIGEDAPVVTSEVYNAAKQRQSQIFNDLTARNAMKVDDQLVRSLKNIADSSKVGGAAITEQVEAAIDALYAQATTGKAGVVVPGEAYQAFDAQLNQIIKQGGPPSHFIGNVQSAVRRAMDKSISKEDAAAWRSLRTEYGNRKALAPLVAKASDGPISPPQLMGAVTNSRGSKEAMASGTRGELGELAKIGQRMKEPPSSGTAERGAVTALLGTGAYLDPVTGGLSALGLNALSRGLDSTLLAKVLMRQNPGLTAKGAAMIIQRGASPTGETYNASRPLEIEIRGGTRGAAPSQQQVNALRGY
jgi:hypothetical protein